ncbi:MAG: sugar phosphate isomerase/epimerase [Ruminococcaceae bacterium]|nr:sugar phosphate isomerase/epimerase [Oscillospiraceae bacterium]
MDIVLQIKYSEAFDKEYLAFLKKCGYDGVELLLDGEVGDAETIKKNVSESGLYVAHTQLDKENIENGLAVSSLLGVKWACLPIVINYDSDIICNAIPLAEKYNVGIAIENPATHDDITDTFCIYADSFNSEFIGVCYNIGHANLAGSDDFGIKKFDVDKAEALRKVGDRIKMLHVNDNHGDVDRRLCPTVANAVCSVEWGKIIDALKDIGFNGAFSLNCELDFEEYCLRDDYIRFIANVCNILLGKEVAQ